MASRSEPGALEVFDFSDGVLSNEVSVAPDGGYGFGPRHLDFHPSKPWVYVSLERQNALDMFELAGWRAVADTAFPQGRAGRPRPPASPAVGTVHVHPNGRTVYVANRPAKRAIRRQRVFAGGENSLAVYAIDQATGEPNLIQHIDTHGVHPRTFHIDPSGRLMVVAHIMGLSRDGDASAIAAVCRCSASPTDGRLDFARAYDIDVGATHHVVDGHGGTCSIGRQP